MQDGRDERPRGGATSALDDGQTKGADGFGRKSSDESDVAVMEPAAPARAERDLPSPGIREAYAQRVSRRYTCLPCGRSYLIGI